MSNKLKKTSPGFNEVKELVKKKIEEEGGGVNVTPTWIKEFTEAEDENKKVTQDEFYTILAELVEKDEFHMYKIVQISKDGETRGMMLCDPDTSLVFYKEPKSEEKEETKDEKEDKEKEIKDEKVD